VITTVTARDSEMPVSLLDAKRHLRVGSDDHDEYIESLVAAATGYCESVTGRALRKTHTLTQKYGQWPCNPVRFDRQPLLAVSSVAYRDADGNSQTVSSSLYRVHLSSEAAGYLEFDEDFTRPTLDVRDDAITVTYTAGYTTIAAVPELAKHAIKLLVGHWFEHGEAVNIGNITTEVPMATAALLQSLDWGCYR
jgi:uncharacterized phiE125 gp8 family phage protein